MLKAAEGGDSNALVWLGDCYYKGLCGTEASYTKAYPFFLTAARMGNAAGQCWTGVCLANGKGVREDKEQAAEWYQAAAQQGDELATYYLGWCYYRGAGVKIDRKKGLELIEKAAEMEVEHAMAFLERLGE